MTPPEPSENVAATAVCDPVIRGFIAPAGVCVRGVAAPARESRGIAGSHTTPTGGAAQSL